MVTKKAAPEPTPADEPVSKFADFDLPPTKSATDPKVSGTDPAPKTHDYDYTSPDDWGNDYKSTENEGPETDAEKEEDAEEAANDPHVVTAVEVPFNDNHSDEVAGRDDKPTT